MRVVDCVTVAWNTTDDIRVLDATSSNSGSHVLVVDVITAVNIAHRTDAVTATASQRRPNIVLRCRRESLLTARVLTVP